MNIPKWLEINLTKKGLEQIEKSIIEAEKKTNAEIVPMIVKESSYSYKVEILILFLVTLLSIALMPIHFSILVILAYIVISRRLKSMRKTMTHQRAISEFYESNIHQTKNSTGVLLFVSLKEKQIEVIADQKVDIHVESETWDNVVSIMINEIKNGNMDQAFIKGIASLGETLSNICPGTHDDTDEIHNHLIIKE
jgi:putative membrane protein